ncbi:MAG: hypothetical protein HQL69_02215 [Magnetococcales bacterium]|nr:hypothetical protein [Magnetococcales bacterium]
MSRLSEYMAQLSKLLGSQEKVHFGGLLKGSTILRVCVEDEVEKCVVKRLQAANSPGDDSDARKHYITLNGMLQFDKAVGTIRREKGESLLIFPGRKTVDLQPIGPIKQPSAVEGVLIRIGGKDSTIPAYIESIDGISYILELRSRELAKKMSKHLFENIRVSGEGQWERKIETGWTLKKLVVQDFELLEEASLLDSVAALRMAPKSDWQKLDDPMSTWKDMRES